MTAAPPLVDEMYEAKHLHPLASVIGAGDEEDDRWIVQVHLRNGNVTTHVITTADLDEAKVDTIEGLIDSLTPRGIAPHWVWLGNGRYHTGAAQAIIINGNED